MNEERREEIIQRLDAATKRPWRAEINLDFGGHWVVLPPDSAGDLESVCVVGAPSSPRAEADAELIAHAPADIAELLDDSIVAERFVAHANAIWNVAFPDDPDGWEYGAQLERCVKALITEQRDEIRRLSDLIKQQGGEDDAD